ncbi:hypothetical protein Afil01_28710 [Actinorhabdospora filicis]|uniref:Uncharacterized protein n=1 Tax=Actinorhabdospora filicis TaxID=1785913 RepID=A0A9W6W8Z7_9ACTN|nr:DUF6247 family protein [Actinorhabdospora filicis]GLZ78064.1 hypothetical protein Afil01_28710 [Actinorhabdospora filicis]
MEMLTGQETYTLLNAGDRELFDTEWRQALALAAKDFDLEALMLMVCRWWITAGGDPARAESTRTDYARMSAPQRLTGLSGPVIACTPKAVREALTDEQAWEFEASWEATCRGETLDTHDWNPLNQLTAAWYRWTQTTPEDLAREQELTTTVENAIAEGRLGDLYAQGVLIDGKHTGPE